MPATSTPATNDVLAKALERQAPALLTLELGDKRLQLPLKLMEGAEADGEDGVYAEVAGAGRYALDELIKRCLPVKVSFQDGSAVVSFQTFVLKKRKHFWLNKMVLLRRPTRVSVVEQRHDARQAVPKLCEVVAKVSPAKEEGSTASVVAKVCDLSRGGASLILSTDQARSLASKEGSVRLDFDFNGEAICVDAELRNSRALSSHTVRVGLRFTGAGTSAPATNEHFLHQLSSFEERNIQSQLREQLKKR